MDSQDPCHDDDDADTGKAEIRRRGPSFIPETSALLGFGPRVFGGYAPKSHGLYRFRRTPKGYEMHVTPPPRINLPSFAWDIHRDGALNQLSVLGAHGHACNMILCPITGGVIMVSNFMIVLSWFLSTAQKATRQSVSGVTSADVKAAAAETFPKFFRSARRKGNTGAVVLGPVVEPTIMFDPIRRLPQKKNSLGCHSMHHPNQNPHSVLTEKEICAGKTPVVKMNQAYKYALKARCTLVEQVGRTIYNHKGMCLKCCNKNVRRQVQSDGFGMSLQQIEHRFAKHDAAFVKSWQAIFDPTIINAAVLAGLSMLCPTPQAANEPGNMMKHGSILRTPYIAYLIILNWRVGFPHGPNPPLRKMLAALYSDGLQVGARIAATLGITNTAENCYGRLRMLLRDWGACQQLATYGRAAFPEGSNIPETTKRHPAWFIRYSDNPPDMAQTSTATGWMLFQTPREKPVVTAVENCVWDVMRCIVGGWKVTFMLMPRLHLKCVKPAIRGFSFGVGSNEPLVPIQNIQFYGEQMTWWKLHRLANCQRAKQKKPHEFDELVIHGSITKATEGLVHTFYSQNAVKSGPLAVTLGKCFLELCVLARQKHPATPGLSVQISPYSDYCNYEGKLFTVVKEANERHQAFLSDTTPVTLPTDMATLSEIADDIKSRSMQIKMDKQKGHDSKRKRADDGSPLPSPKQAKVADTI